LWCYQDAWGLAAKLVEIISQNFKIFLREFIC
jgi:hypothetical protein